MTEKKQRFSWRGWTTFVVTISFIVDTVSGIFLYVAPHGRVANWTDWRIWGLTKEEWGAIHTIFGYILLIIVALHLYYNWKIFWNFVWSKIHRALNMRWEMITGALVCLLIFLGTLWDVPPFSSTMVLGEYLKESWEENKTDKPISNAETLTLEKFAETAKLPVEHMKGTLESKGVNIKDTQQTLGEVAKENETSPEKLYEMIKSGDIKPSIPENVQGSGAGRKTLETISTEKGISLEDVLARLERKGIAAKPSDKLKDVAAKLGKTPTEISAVIEGKE